MARRTGMVIVLAMAGLLASCGQDNPTPSGGTSASVTTGAGTPDGNAGRSSASATAATAPTGPGDAAKGRQVWLTVCVACHASDPAKDGPVGPAVKGSTRELVEARVLRAQYPPGYTPKRPSRVMPARPDLAASVPDLAAFLR